MNHVSLTGRLTRDPEIKKTNSGISVSQFYIAVNRFPKKEGQPEADFISCVVWNKSAENLCTYCHKGDRIGVSGKIQTRTYQDNQGQTKYVVEVIVNELEFLQSRSQNNNQNQSYQAQYNQKATSYQQANAQSEWTVDDISPDDLPF